MQDHEMIPLMDYQEYPRADMAKRAQSLAG